MLCTMNTSHLSPEQNEPSSHIAVLQAELVSLHSSLTTAARHIARVYELLNAESTELPSSSTHEAYESPATLIQPSAWASTDATPEDHSRRINNNEVLKGVDERLKGLAG